MILATLDADLRGIALVIAALGSTITAVLGVANRNRLSTKAVNGTRNIFGKPKRKNIGDLVALLEARTARFDSIEAKINRVLDDIEDPRDAEAIHRERERVREQADRENRERDIWRQR